MRILKTILIVIIFSGIANSQEEETVQIDNIFLDNIYTAYFRINEGQLPIYLSEHEALSLVFDDIDSGVKEYYYKIYHCDKDWVKSDIGEWEFTDGINEYYIEDYVIDNARYSEYTTYHLSLPNEDVSLLISGNYILEVYDNSEDEPMLAFTKRFIYPENKVFINKATRTVQSENYLHNQEVNFDINFGRFPMVSPKEEVFTTVYQNGNWSSGQHNLKTSYIHGTSLKFNTASPIVFPGIKEYRMFDIRGLKFTSRYVEAIDRHENGTDVLLRKDRKRYEYFSADDFNGAFVIYENTYVSEGEEYVNVIFNLESNVEYDQDVYVFGAISEWGLKEKFKMEYDDLNSIYIANVLLKQGVYNYMYALDNDGKVDLKTIEGSSSETGNLYNIVNYYRTLGTDYDRVLSISNYSPFYE